MNSRRLIAFPRVQDWHRNDTKPRWERPRPYTLWANSGHQSLLFNHLIGAR